MGFGKGMAEKLDLPKEVVLDLPWCPWWGRRK